MFYLLNLFLQIWTSTESSANDSGDENDLDYVPTFSNNEQLNETQRILLVMLNAHQLLNQTKEYTAAQKGDKCGDNFHSATASLQSIEILLITIFFISSSKIEVQSLEKISLTLM